MSPDMMPPDASWLPARPKGALADATQALRDLATRIGGERHTQAPAGLDADDLGLGPVPDHLRQLTGDGGVTRALIANVTQAPNMTELRAALLHVPAEYWASRDSWHNTLVAGLSGIAEQFPSLASEARALLHEIAKRPGTGKYDQAENDEAFEDALKRAAERRQRAADCVGAGRLFTIARQHGWVAPVVAPQAAPLTGSALPATIDRDRFKIGHPDMKPARRRPMRGGFAFEGQVTVVSARGGVAKSTLVINETIALASGRDLGGPSVNGVQRSVLFISAEDSRGEMAARFGAALRLHNLSHGGVPSLYVMGAEDAAGYGLTLTTGTDRTASVNHAGLANLEGLVSAFQAEVVVLDPWAAMLPVGANDNGLTYSVMLALKGIAARNNCAFIIVAHDRKGGAAGGADADAVAGASALVNAARVAWRVRVPDGDEAAALGVPVGQEANLRALEPIKANLGAPRARYFTLEPVPMFPKNARFPEPDVIAAAREYTPPPAGAIPSGFSKAHRAAAEAIATGVNGVPLSSHGRAGHRSAIAVLAPIVQPHLPNVPPARLDAAIRRILGDLKGAGVVREGAERIPRPDGRGGNKGAALRVDWNSSPWADAPAPGPFVTEPATPENTPEA